jgi:hypothetical protein
MLRCTSVKTIGRKACPKLAKGLLGFLHFTRPPAFLAGEVCYRFLQSRLGKTGIKCTYETVY